MKPIVGGGTKKVLYTLNTLKKIGVKKSAKALLANNTCKACGLGMGGQRGGMTNELGEFPAVCNKSVQAQSTDIQPPIPAAIFEHSLSELRELTPRELEHIGRLNTPLFKEKNTDKYHPVEWDWALSYAAKALKDSQPERTFFYSSGRSSNEAGFLLQLLARHYGTNNINNCSYYCHQATSVGLDSTIGTGTATIELDDLSGCDLIFVIGANPSSNHPRFIHKLKACRERGGHVIVINPAKEPGMVKFAVPKSPLSLIAGGTDIASDYLQPKIGSDIALIKGISKAIIEANQHDSAFIAKHTHGFTEFTNDIQQTSWQDITRACGIAQQDIEKAAQRYAQAKHVVFAWGMGMTHHQFGSENVEYIANLCLLRGMIGKPHAGLLPLRGHSNVQGIGTMGVKPVLADEILQLIEKEFDIKLPTTTGLDTYNALIKAQEKAIDCALMMGGNLYAATPNSAWAARALNNIPSKIFLTTTLNQGHLHGIDGDVLILPVLARDEEQQATTQESMFNYVRLSDGGITRVNNARSEVSILADIGSRLHTNTNIDYQQFKNHDSIRASISAIVPGLSELKSIGIAKQEFHVQNRLLHTPTFRTQSGKATFIVHPLPVINAQQHTFPFLLASVRSEGQFNSIIYEETDSYRYQATRNSVLMCEKDMAKIHLKAGDTVNLMSEFGEMHSVTVQPFDIAEGSVLAYYPEANALTGHTLDPRSKTPNFKSIPIKIIKAHP